MKSFITYKDVRFGHVDPAGIVYFPRIYDYVHEAFEELWAVHVGKRYYDLVAVDRLGFPLVHSEVDFKHPLRFGDRASVRITCFRLGRSSLGLRYQYSLDETACVDARMTTACVNLDALEAREIPASYRAKFEEIGEHLEDQ